MINNSFSFTENASFIITSEHTQSGEASTAILSSIDSLTSSYTTATITSIHPASPFPSTDEPTAQIFIYPPQAPSSSSIGPSNSSTSSLTSSIDTSFTAKTQDVKLPCPCKRGLSPQLPLHILSHLPGSIAKLKGVEPVNLNESDPLLTGRVTIQEEQLPCWDQSIILPPSAQLSHVDKLCLLKSLKLGQLPSLTIHNLSVIFQRAPSTPRLSRSTHFCLLCGASLSRRDDLLFHLQRFHTGFAVRCTKCQAIFPTERAALSHLKRAHRMSIPTGSTVCGGTRQVYTTETTRVGSIMATMTFDNLFIRLSLQSNRIRPPRSATQVPVSEDSLARSIDTNTVAAPVLVSLAIADLQSPQSSQGLSTSLTLAN